MHRHFNTILGLSAAHTPYIVFSRLFWRIFRWKPIDGKGKPVAFYSDKHGVFRINAVGAVQGDGMTQYGRALHELNIEIICANTPQAKGRVERANKTLQDRLV